MKELTREQESEIYQAELLKRHVLNACSSKAIENKFGITAKQRIEVVRKWDCTEKNYTD